MTPSPDFLAQHAALTQGVGLAFLEGRTLLAVAGSDRASFLHSFTTNDVKRLTPGTGCEAFVTSTNGKTLGHIFVFCEANQHLLDTTPGQSAALSAHFDRYVITEDVQFIDRTAEFRDLLVSGPVAATLLESVSGVYPPTALLAHAPATIAGQAVVIRRVDFAGPNSFFVQAAVGDAVAAALKQAGAVVCERAAIEAARLEAGFPLFGSDIGPDNLPQEVNRDQQAISFTKGCYLGQETVARIDAIGHVNRLLVGLRFTGSDIPAVGTGLLLGEQQVGQVTSAAWSPRLGSPLVLAYVRRNHAKRGVVLACSTGVAEAIDLPVE